MSNFIYIMVAGTFLTAISQILLKQSADEKHESFIKEYLNWKVIVAYILFGTVLLSNTYAYTRVDMKYGAVIETLAYVWIFIMSVTLLHEKITRRKLLGNLLIITGILIYRL
ncbi:MAG: EamA family transporter [Blautia sp.]|nr:EamA family transporter [Blautia sp.]